MSTRPAPGADAIRGADAGAGAASIRDAGAAKSLVPDKGPQKKEPARVTEQGPLDPEVQKVFWSTPEEKEPRKRSKDHTYWIGNEWELFLFYPFLKGLGGGYLGVGPDQAYLFIGWMRPVLAWLVDYDAAVVDLHAVHQAFLLAASTPQEFGSFWSKRSSARALEVLDEAYKSHDRRKEYKKVYGKALPTVSWRLKRVIRIMNDRKIPCFLNHQPTYDFVREFVRHKRARAMVTDLRGKSGIQAIGRAARGLGVPVRAVYLSNAEEYWKRYRPEYKKNIESLFFDERSVVLRTISTVISRNRYDYHVQPGLNYQAWLRLPHITNMRRIRSRVMRRYKWATLHMANLPPTKRKTKKKQGKAPK